MTSIYATRVVEFMLKNSYILEENILGICAILVGDIMMKSELLELRWEPRIQDGGVVKEILMLEGAKQIVVIKMRGQRAVCVKNVIGNIIQLVARESAEDVTMRLVV